MMPGKPKPAFDPAIRRGIVNVGADVAAEVAAQIIVAGFPRFSDDETISGVKNGVNVTFTLFRTPSPAASLRFYWNGVLLKRGAGYTLSGATVTVAAGYEPQATDTLAAFFRY